MHLACHFVPNVDHHIPLLPRVDVGCALGQPVAQVLPLIPGNVELESAVRHEDPEGVPCERINGCLGHPLSAQGLLEPSQGSDQIIHALELLEGYHLPHERQEGEPPWFPREAVLGPYQRDRLLPDLGSGNRLSLPCLQFHRTGSLSEIFGAHVLQVIETSAAAHLEPGNAQDEGVHHALDRCVSRQRGLRVQGRRTLHEWDLQASRSFFQGPDHLLGGHRSFPLGSDCGVGQLFFQGLLLVLEAVELVDIQEAEDPGKPSQGLRHLIDLL